jgi:hypothetical protein
MPHRLSQAIAGCYRGGPGLGGHAASSTAVIRANRPMISADDISNGVARRLERQSLFDRTDPPLLWVVLRETA